MIRYTCPTCGKITAVERRQDAPCRPFCSDRCQKVDLGKWLSGEYVVSEPLHLPADEHRRPDSENGSEGDGRG